MADLFDGYLLGQQWDEMFGAVGSPRPAYAGLFASLQPIDGEELAARADLLSQTYRDAGVTFAHAGEELGALFRVMSDGLREQSHNFRDTPASVADGVRGRCRNFLPDFRHQALWGVPAKSR